MGRTLKTIRLLILCTFLFIFAACSDQQRMATIQDAPLISRTLVDGTGREIRLPRAPRSFISIAPNITEIIYALGAEDKLLARSEACNYPGEALSLEAIPTYPELDLEMLKSFRADLILSTDEIFGAEQLAAFETVGIAVYLQSYDSLDDVFKGIREIGSLVGKPDAANLLSDSLVALTHHIIDSTQNQIKYGTLIYIGDSPLEVVGGKGILNELIVKAGGRNVFADKDSAFYLPTKAEIIQLQPEFVIIPSVSDQAYANLLALYPELYNTPADVSKQVFILDPELLFRPGPRIVEGLLLITRTLHGKLGREVFVN